MQGAQLARLNVSAAAGTSDVGEVANRDVSGIALICSAPGVADKVTVSAELTTEELQKVIVPTIPGRLLLEVSDVQAGQGIQDVQLAIEGDAAAASLRKVVAGRLALGRLKLRGGDKLQGVLTATAALAADEWVILCWYRHGMLLGEKIIAYRILDADKAQAFNDVACIFGHRRIVAAAADEASALTGAKLEAIVKLGEEEQTQKGDVAYGLTLALGKVAAMGPRQTVCFYDDEGVSVDGIQDAHITLSGTDAASWSLFVGQYQNHVQRAAKKGLEAVQEAAARVEKVETQRPSEAQAARYQGRVPPSEKLRQLEIVRAPNVPGIGGGAFRPRSGRGLREVF